jgi:NADPH:quinone reductase-like Zn-dependent oxidoreductase
VYALARLRLGERKIVSASPVLLVYGATGYVGEHAVRIASRSGIQTVAGRAQR